MRKFLPLFLIVLLFATACGGRTEEKDSPSSGLTFQTAEVYQTERLPLPAEEGELLGSCTDGENLYYLTAEGEQTAICRVALPGGETEILDAYHPTQAAPETVVPIALGLVLDPKGGLWTLEAWTVFTYDLPENFDEAEDEKYHYMTGRDAFFRLRQLDPATGRAIRELDVTEAVCDLGDDWNGGWAVDGDGNIYFAFSAGVTVLNNEGERDYTLESEVHISNRYGASGGPLALLPDGRVAVLVKGTATAQSGGKREVWVVDAAAKDWSDEKYSVSGKTEWLHTGSGGALFCYTADDALYVWNARDSAAYKLLNWSSAGMSGSGVLCLSLLDDGQAAVLSRNGGGVQLELLTPTDKLEDGRTVLVYGTIRASSSLQYRIKQFNEASKDYYVAIRDYADGLEPEVSGMTWAEAIDNAQLRANVEFTSGKIPDILDGDVLPLARYAAKGMLEDLWPWIDSDPELGREALMTHVLDCASVDGKLYRIGSTFIIVSLMTSSSMVEKGEDLTLEKLLERYEAMPEGSTILGAGYGPEETLLCLSNGGGSYVDWSTGECRFDSDSFKELLELCARIEDAGDYTDDGGAALREGRQLLSGGYISNMGQFRENEARCGGPQALWDYEGLLRENGVKPDFPTSSDLLDPSNPLTDLSAFADDVVFGALRESEYAVYVGVPTEGTFKSYFDLDREMAISASSQHKEGAWAFLRQLLLPDGALEATSLDVGINDIGLKNFYFPVNREDFEAFMAAEMETEWFVDEKGEYILTEDGQRIEKASHGRLLGYPVRMYVYDTAATQEDCDRFMALYHSIDRMSYDATDSNIRDIVLSQAAPYFAGDATLEDTAAAIQSRVKLYVNEQR